MRLLFPESLHRKLIHHLFPGDFREHGAVLAAGLASTRDGPRLLVREVWPANEPADYRLGDRGHMGLQATFIHRCITRCRDQRLVYLAVHNHGESGHVAFSGVDMASHERGYGALLDIAEGMPVGALVVAEGAMEVDLWLPDGSRSALREARVVGSRIDRIYPNSSVRSMATGGTELRDERYSRQALFLGREGQALFRRTRVAVIGLGGVGSLLNEYLARLGVGSLLLIDPDRLETSNVSRVVGARAEDLLDTSARTLKVGIAERVAREAAPRIDLSTVADDFARLSVAQQALDCDFLFLAADSMRARLVFNALVQQYYIPGVQLGSKVRVNPRDGRIESAFSVVRHVRPSEGCLLCNQLIDAAKLADEWKTDSERRDQHYGLESPNPSVITMNAVAAAHGVNDFLFMYTGLTSSSGVPPYRRFDHLKQTVVHEQPRRDESCPECSTAAHSRLGFGDARALPCAQ